MQTETGHIFNQDKIDMESIGGTLVPWEVGEEVEVKGCRFKVKEINVFPKDEIILVGMPIHKKTLIEELSEEIPIEREYDSRRVMRDFIRNKK